MRRLLLPAAALLALALPVPAALGFRPVPGNPANRLAALPMDPETYDPATHCARAPRPGMVLFQHWLEQHARGVSWGSYRCERWGRRSASLHAENRALDWHLDVHRRADRREARRLIDLLLAPDRRGEPHALARRMGIEEIIWNCAYWGAGMPAFEPYSVCERKGVDDTTAHRNHIHFGMSLAGAAAKTSFWRR